jgi:vesicle-associated membrane protein 7
MIFDKDLFVSLCFSIFFETDMLKASYGERAKTAIAYSLNGDFQRVLRQQMQVFNEKANNTKLDQIQQEISGVKQVMVQNIDKVLARGEKIELLVDKSANLDHKAQLFQKEAKKVKNVMWWRNVRMWILLLFVLAIISVVIAGFACGGVTFPNCQAKK